MEMSRQASGFLAPMSAEQVGESDCLVVIAIYFIIAVRQATSINITGVSIIINT
jgi:hypothetical protein